MFLIPPPPMRHIFFVLLTFIISGTISFGLIFGTQYIIFGRDHIDNWANKYFTTMQKILLLINVLITIGAFMLMTYGFEIENWLFSMTGLIVLCISALIGAYTASPLKFFSMPDRRKPEGNWGYVLYIGIVITVYVINFILIIISSWIFTLIKIFKESSERFRIVTVCVLLTFVAVVFAGMCIHNTYL